MAKTKYTKKKAKQTLNEFRAWLQGVEEMQEDGWIPSIDQWKLIRDRIDNITEPTPVAPAFDAVHRQPVRQQVRQPAAPHGAFDAPDASSSFDGATVDLTAPVPRAPKQGQPQTSLGAEKTPDVEAGAYKSGFV
jgi:hypothetical protein